MGTRGVREKRRVVFEGRIEVSSDSGKDVPPSSLKCPTGDVLVYMLGATVLPELRCDGVR